MEPVIFVAPHHALTCPLSHRFSSAPLRRTFLISIIGRLPIGVTGLGILVLVQSATSSFARGGFAAGCYVSGLALAAPGLGRMIDRLRGCRALA